jgi:hypothetical protein
MPAGRALLVFDMRLIQVYTTGVLLRKDASYTPPRGIRAANSGGGIDCKNVAGYLLGRASIELGKEICMPFDTSTIPDRLKEAARNRVLVPFVGAGLSKQADTTDKKAFPTWIELLAELLKVSLTQNYISADEAKQVGKLIRQGRYLMAAQALRAGMPADALESLIVKRYYPTDARPGEVHKWLFKLEPDIVITTNYDKLIEDAFAMVFKKVPYAWTFKNAPEVQRSLQGFRRGIDRPIIFKLHGCVGSPADTILSEMDYRQLLYREPGYKMVLSAIFVTRVVLMLGFSFSDPELSLLMETMRDSLKNQSSPDYIFLPHGAKASVEKKRLRDDFGLEVIEYEPSPDHREVLDLLKYLAACKKATKGKKTP